MFSLIIAIIAIALVAVLALATVYYGGSAFNQGSTNAAASKLINEGQQIAAAVQMLQQNRLTGVTDTISTVAGLAPAYLSTVPTDYAQTADLAPGAVASFVETASGVSAAVCSAVNSQAGITSSTVAAGSAGYLFGCDQTSTTASYVWYAI